MPPVAARLEAVAALLTSRRWSRRRLDAHRDRQLRRLVRWAGRRVPHYRRAFAEAGLDPREFRGVGDLGRLPILEKSVLRRGAESQMLADGARQDRLVRHRTNGTTGQPIALLHGWLEERLLAAFRRRAMHDQGLRVRDRIAHVRFHDHLHAGDRQGALRRVRGLGLYESRSFHCLRDPATLAREIAAYRPGMVTGFPMIVTRVAEESARLGLAQRPRLVVLGGENITAQQRGTIAAAWRCPVFEIYGCAEVNLIAWQRRGHDRLTLMDDAVVVEIVRPDGSPAAPGESGEVLVTGLHTFAMPILRLRLGDLAAFADPEQRPADRLPYGRLQRVVGRINQYFTLPSGAALHPWHLTIPVLCDYPWVGQYQLTQERRDRIVLRIIPGDAPGDQELDRLDRQLGALLPEPVELAVELVDELPLEPNGKFQMVRSRVASPAGR